MTSGSENIDYFISGEYMEPNLQDPMSDELHYSEQVVRLVGQGIWYDQVPVPVPLPWSQENTAYGIHKKEWSWLLNESNQKKSNVVVYLCPQSSFKLHPDFDLTLARILRRVPQGHLVLLKGRRDTWTEMVQHRMRSTAFRDNSIWDRVHFISRVSGSDNFLNILQRADVM